MVDLLVADDSNPRSIAYQVAAIEQHLSNLPRQASHPQSSPHIQLIVQLRTKLEVVELQAACIPSETASRSGRLAFADRRSSMICSRWRSWSARFTSATPPWLAG